MRSSTACLPADEIPRLLSGDLPPDEAAAAENHIAECTTCRSAIESMIADAHWWDDVQQSLAHQPTGDFDNSGNEPSGNADEPEPTTIEPLLELLGPTDDPAMLGRIGAYEIVGILGRGGMGAVFKGYDGALNRFVAIKMLLPHLAVSGAARKRFEREAQAAAAVVDDHVMAIHGVSEWNSVPYFVMPYARGVSLQKRLNDNGPLDVREILRIAMQAAKGLAAAHAQGLVHRDVKPANIFLDEGVERVQLMDFGLARAVDDASLTRSGTLAGTPQYMSPEQARAESVDDRSDLFSLGSVLYAMCTGHAPFRAESSYSVLRLITDKEPRPIRELNPEIPEWLCAIIGKLISKQASDRFGSAQDVAELLEACLAHVQQPTTTPLQAEVQALAAQTQLSSVKKPTPKRLKAGPQRRPPIGKLLVAAAFAFSLYFSGVLIVLELNKGTLRIESEMDDVPILIMRGDETVDQLTISQAGASVRVTAGTYRIEIAGEFPQLSVVNGVVSLKRGDFRTVTIAIAGRTSAQQKGESASGNHVPGSVASETMSLSAKINAFNQGLKKRFPNFDQPPLTEQELIACASWSVQYDTELSETLKSGLHELAQKHHMIEELKFEGGYATLQIGKMTVECFQIFLVNSTGFERFAIRERYLSCSASDAEPAKKPTSGTALATAVNRFNARYKTANGQVQPPLTEEEVIAAIVHQQLNRDALDVSDSLFAKFQDIARTRFLPEGAEIELISKFGSEAGTVFTIWSIRIKMLQDEKGKEGWTVGFGIRSQFIGVRHGDAASIHWGPPGKNGLQAGVRLSPPLLSYEMGQKIDVEFLYRNILGKPMTGSFPNYFTYHRIEARDAEGAKLEVVERPEELIIGGAYGTSIGDEPISCRSQPLMMVPVSTTKEQRDKIFASSNARTLILAEPGQSCKLTFMVRNYADDADGTLETGEIEFDVADAAIEFEKTVPRDFESLLFPDSLLAPHPKDTAKAAINARFATPQSLME